MKTHAGLITLALLAIAVTTSACGKRYAFAPTADIPAAHLVSSIELGPRAKPTLNDFLTTEIWHFPTDCTGIDFERGLDFPNYLGKSLPSTTTAGRTQDIPSNRFVVVQLLADRRTIGVRYECTTYAGFFPEPGQTYRAVLIAGSGECMMRITGPNGAPVPYGEPDDCEALRRKPPAAPPTT